MSKCFICNQVSDRLVWREREYEARLCSCGLVYTHPTPPTGAIDYTASQHDDEFYSYYADFKASWMARHCPTGRLLEVGCGDGAFLAAAQARGYEVFGLEPHPERAHRVQEQLGINVEQTFLENNTLPEKSFDVIYHCDLLAHFPDPKQSLCAMSALLQPGGVLCFEVGLLGGISPGWYRLIGQLDLGDHLWFFSDRSLKLLLSQAGLHIEKIQYFGLAPTVLLNRVCELVRAAAVRISSAAPNLRILPSPENVNSFFRKLMVFLRYRLGAISPRVGPQTLFVVVSKSGRNVADS
jgi:SAM-dependent methyltransferase